jgi:DNA-binding transcriptional MocR family regulator
MQRVSGHCSQNWSLRMLFIHGEMPALLREWYDAARRCAINATEQKFERARVCTPSKRNLATASNISQSTTVRAWELLVERGTVRRVHAVGAALGAQRIPPPARMVSDVSCKSRGH